MEYKLIDKTPKYEGPKLVSLEPKKEKPKPEYKAETVELSDNIKKFDALKRTPEERAEFISKEMEVIPTASEMICDPLYNKVGRLLSVDTISDWKKNYDKIYEIVKLAKDKTKSNDLDRVIGWIYNMTNYAPSITDRKLNDLYTYLMMGAKQKETKPKVITRTVTKTIVKYVKPKNTIDNFVNNLMNLNVN